MKYVTRLITRWIYFINKVQYELARPVRVFSPPSFGNALPLNKAGHFPFYRTRENMRKSAKTDSNQSSIVEALRAIGCTVQILAQVGNGCPDLLVGFSGINLLLEVKDGSKAPSARKLTADQVVWHGEWRGQVQIVYDAEHAFRIVNWYRRHGITPQEKGDRSQLDWHPLNS